MIYAPLLIVRNLVRLTYQKAKHGHTRKRFIGILLNSGARLLNSAFERRISEAGLGLTPAKQEHC